MLTNELSSWSSHLQQQLIINKCVENDIHVVIYTDGGCRPNPGFGGVGVHGYFYTTDKPKTGYGTKGFKPTNKGYVNNERPIDDPVAVAEFQNVADESIVVGETPVTVIAFFDIASGLEGTSTNNSAELASFVWGLLILKNVKVKSALFILDSRYVLNNTKQNLETWANNRWRGSDGSEVKNRYLWENVYGLFSTLKTECEIVLDWTKGHSDDAGNLRADHNASSASIAAVNKKQIVYERLFPSKGYWNPESDYHRFFTESRWYFLTHKPLPEYYTSRGAFYVYYIGNHGSDDDMFGKPATDTVYGIIALRNKNVVLHNLKEHVDEVTYTQTRASYSLPVIGQLNNIFKPMVYRDLILSDCKHLYKQNEKPELYAPPEVLLTTERNPPLLATRAFDHFTALEMKLLSFLNGEQDPIYIYNNITNFIYEQVETKKKQTLKVSPNLAMDTQSIKIDVEYNHNNERLKSDVVLTCGLDIPKRNLFTALLEKKPEVYVLTWPEASSRKAFRYATIVVCDDAVGIWAGVYSNLRLVI